MIRLENVYKVYEKDWMALYDVCLEIGAGEMVFVLGSSGAGKTTLLDLMAMTQPPSQGTVTTLGFNSGSIKRRHIPRLRRKLGLIFQDYKLIMDRTVFENVAFAGQMLGRKRSTVADQTLNALHLVDLMDHKEKFPYQLSGGEQQRVGIARALINEPEIILADEPTGNINEELAVDILLLLQRINQDGTTVVMATHNRRLVEKMPFRRIELEKGAVKSDGTPGGVSIREATA